MKNKRISQKFRIFVLVIIAVLMSPLVSALSFGQSVSFLGDWRWFVVNAFVLFIIFFIAQSVLIGKKADKERTVSWIIVIILSLAISWFLSEPRQYLWDHPKIGFVFNLPVIVNAAIIGLSIWVILPWLKVDIKSGKSQIALGILIAIIALSISSAAIIEITDGQKVLVDGKPKYVYLWQKEGIKSMINYFLGDEGVLTLNPAKGNYRLFIFILLSILGSWLFTFLKISEAGNRISYALAIIIAMSIAKMGISIDSTIALGQIIFILVVGSKLGDTWTFGENKGIRYVISFALAFVLIIWVSITAIPGCGILPGDCVIGKEEAVKAAKAAQEKPAGVPWWLWVIKTPLRYPLIFVGSILVPLLLMVITMKEGREMLKKRAWPLLLTRIKDSANEGILKYIPFLKKIEPKWPILEGLLPTSVRKLRLIYQILADYVLRLDIFHAKRGVMDSKEKTVADLKKEIKEHVDLDELRYELIVFRSGGAIIKEDGTLENFRGWNMLNKEINEILNSVYETATRFLIRKAIIRRIRRGSDPEGVEGVRGRLMSTWLGAERAIEFDKLRPPLESITRTLVQNRGAYLERLDGYGGHHGIRAEKLKLFDMFNLYGKFLRSYRFAKKGAELSGGGIATNDLTEVSFGGVFFDDGVIIDDINKLKTINRFAGINKELYDSHKNELKKLRDVSGIVDAKNFQDVVGWMKPDWEGFLRDLRWGEYHPNSRTIDDYDKAWGEYIYDDNKISQRGAGTPIKGNPAIDLRALANPNFHYWGRFNFADSSPDAIKNIVDRNRRAFQNPYPTLSTLGMALYIDHYIRKKEQDVQTAKGYIRGYPTDIGKGHETAEKTAGAFEEAETQ